MYNARLRNALKEHTNLPWIKFFVVIAFAISYPLESYSRNDAYEDLIKQSINIVNQDESSIRLNFRLPDYDIVHGGTNGSGGGRIRYIDNISIYSGMTPAVPVITELIRIPDHMTAQISIINVNSRVENKFTLPKIVPSNQIDELTESSEEFADRIWNNYLLSNSSESPVQIGKPVIMRNYHLLPLSIHPFTYNKNTQELHVVKEIEFEVNFITDYSLDNNLGGNKAPQPSRYVDKLVRNLVVNPPPMRDDNLAGGAIAYVTGDWDNVAEALQPLIEWRRKMGWTVDLIRVEENMERAQVKEAIQNAYEEWDITPEYVVLVGDAPGMENNIYNIAFWNVQNGANTAYETDHMYTTLAGDDILPEVAIGRLVFNSIDMLEGQVEKIISYESDPYLPDGDDQNWQIRGAVLATDARSGKSSIDICRWYKYMLQENGFERVDEYYWNNANRQRNPRAFLNATIENGLSFILYRGWSHMNGYTPRDASQHRNGRMLPFVMLATCNTGDYGENLHDPNWSYIERFAWNSVGGAIGAVGAAGATHTAYNNLFATSTMQSPFVQKIYSQGWATMAGKLALMKHYAGLGDIAHPENRQLEAWLTEYYIFNLMGDPAVELFTAVPRVINVSHARELRRGESKFTVRVNYDDDDDPAINTRVCLYMPGEFQHVGYTNDQGIVNYILDPSQMEEGEVFLTASGPNLKPYSVELEIDNALHFLGVTAYEIDDDDEGNSDGDGDEIANPNETIELSVEVTNLGNRTPQGEISVTLSPQSPHIQLDDDTVIIEESPEPGQNETVVFIIEIEGGFPNGNLAEFDVVTSSGEAEWSSSFAFQVDAAQIEFSWLEWDEDDLTPGDTSEAFITIINDGEKATTGLEGVLISLTNTIEVLNDGISFESLAAGDEVESDNLVSVAASEFHINGAAANFALALEDELGFQDTSYFSLNIGRVQEHEPFGPDNYGYICVDNTAESHAIHPTFDWVEIDPSRGGDGTNTGLNDRGEEYDRSVVVELPFEFVYYGESFNLLTICSNGWVAFGDYSLLNSARNRHIPSGEVVPAMLCPFWDDLVSYEDSGVYYWYDERESRFIVEYSNMTKLGPRYNNEATETFQVILLNPATHPTQTGDGDIIFQYLEVEDSRSAFQLWDTPYATVGIGSVDQTDGIEYTYWGQLHPGAAPLEPERAIKFTTMTEYPTVMVTGSVLDADTGDPIPRAKVRASYGNFVLTEDDGSFILGETIAYDNYSFTASKIFYNDSTLTGVAIGVEEDNEIVFRLKHPEFDLSQNELSLASEYVDSVSTSYQIENSGNGVLEFDSEIQFSAEADIWEKLHEIPVGARINDDEIRGVVWADGHWLVSGGANGVNDSTNWFYKFSRHGTYRGRIRQPVDSRFGIRDMEFVNGSIYGLNSYSNVRQILKINPENGAIIRSWNYAENLHIRAIAINPDENRLYVAGTSFGIYEFEFGNDSSLVFIGSHDVVDNRTNNRIQPYGMAIYDQDPDGYNLYLYSNDDPEDNENAPDISIYKVNTNDWSTVFETGLEDLPRTGRGRGGICITPGWSHVNWVVAAVVDVSRRYGHDYLGIFELGYNTMWIDIDPLEGEVLPQEIIDIELTLHTENLDSGSYEFDLEYAFNADPGSQTLPVTVSVLVNVPEDNSSLPDRFSLTQNFPNPFNSTTKISFSLNNPEFVKLIVLDALGREVSTLIQDEHYEAGLHDVSFKGSELPAGIYFYRLQAGDNTAVRKMVMLK